MSADIAIPADEFIGMSRDTLVEAIKKENSKARTKGIEMRRCMERIGRMLIELKDKVPHGNFMATAAGLTGIPHRSITRYMEWALKPITTADLRRIEAPEDMMKLARPATPPPASKVATVANLPATESPPTSPRPRPSTEGAVDAEIVEPQAPTTASSSKTPKYIPNDAEELWVQAKTRLDNILPSDISRESVLKEVIEYCEKRLPAPAVAAPTPSPAPSLIETSEAAFAEILGLLPRLRPVELKELATIISNRWLAAPVSPLDHLAYCWKSANPEQRAAFLETCHHAPAP